MSERGNMTAKRVYELQSEVAAVQATEQGLSNEDVGNIFRLREAQEQIGGKVFLVTDVERLQEKMAKLNKRAEKLGTAPITLIDSGETEKKRFPTGQMIMTLDSAPNEVPVYVTVTMHYVILNGETPKLNGWEFLATLEHDPAGTVIRNTPSFYEREIDTSAYRNADPSNCEHCGLSRQRKDTYLVYNEETDEMKQVGSNCLADFTGFNNPERFAKMMEHLSLFFATLEDEDLDWSSGGMRLPVEYDLVDWMAHVNLEIRTNGWISGKKAWEEGGQSTKARADWNFFERKAEYKVLPEAEDYEAAKAVIEWVRNEFDKEDLNDYEHNLKIAFADDTLPVRQFGISASAYAAMNNWRKRKDQEQAEKPETPLKEGRYEMVGEVVSTEWRLNQFGYGDDTVLKMTVRLEDGNKVWGTVPASLGYDDLVGKMIQFTAKVQPKSEHFGFFSRPTKASIKEEVVA
jgi:hypothetical protein